MKGCPAERGISPNPAITRDPRKLLDRLEKMGLDRIYETGGDTIRTGPDLVLPKATKRRLNLRFHYGRIKK